MKIPPTPDQPAKPPVRRRERATVPTLLPASISNDDGASPSDNQSEKVGYGKPPKHSQFKPGFDPRRPRGRKPGSTNKANSIVGMMESPTTLRSPDGEVRSVSTAEAMARKLRELALSGHLPAISKSFELYQKALPAPPREASPNDQPAADTSAELSASDEAILAWFEEETSALIAKGPKP